MVSPNQGPGTAADAAPEMPVDDSTEGAEDAPVLFASPEARLHAETTKTVMTIRNTRHPPLTRWTGFLGTKSITPSAAALGRQSLRLPPTCQKVGLSPGYPSFCGAATGTPRLVRGLVSMQGRQAVPLVSSPRTWRSSKFRWMPRARSAA